MKKILLFAVITLVSYILKAQNNIWDQNGTSTPLYHLYGNVGIGTLTPFSGTNNNGLHISKGIHTSLILGDPINNYGGIIQTSDSKHRIFVGANLYDDESSSWSSFATGKGSAGISFLADEGGWGTDITFITSKTSGQFLKRMIINGDGNVGIGTIEPNYKLDINGTFHVSNGHNSKIDLGHWGHTFYFTDGTANRVSVATWRSQQSGSNVARISLFDEDGVTPKVQIGSNGSSYFNGGNVGIGTTNPQSLLAVNGTITSKEVEVTMTGWSDFVFYPDYKLKTLEEVEQYIITNKHLPDVPSEKEVKENGLSLGQSDAVLLQKIEELTLYLIEQNKKNKEQSEKIEELAKENKRLKKIEEKYDTQQSVLIELMKRIEKLESN